MASFETVVVLPAPPAECWAFVVHHGRELEPLSFVPEAAQDVGTLNRLSGRVLGIPIRGTSRTVAWDPPNRCAFESVTPTWPIRTTISETFRPAGPGTRHAIEYEVSPRGLVGHVVAPVICWLMKRTRETYQRRLQAALRASTAD